MHVACTQNNHAIRILRVNHAGECGAVNIYRAQWLLAVVLRARHRPMLEEFLQHEKNHRALFAQALKLRGQRRCRLHWLCALGGFALGFVTALGGRRGVMTCTAAVEGVVLKHLHAQLQWLRVNDPGCAAVVQHIVADETAHHAQAQSATAAHKTGRGWVAAGIERATETVIRLGMRM